MATLATTSRALFRLAFVLGIVPFVMVFSVLLQVEYPHKPLSSTVYIPQFLCRFESLSIILTHITNALSLVHEVWEIG